MKTGKWISFDKIFGKELLTKVHNRFKEHIKTFHNEYFTDILKNHLITVSDYNSIVKRFAELDIHMNESEVVHFFEANCYSTVFPKMVKEGHAFTQTEKTYFAGYTMLRDNMGVKDYPYELIEQQVSELRAVSEKFVQTSFDWFMEDCVKAYDEYLKAEGLNT